jgi:hypothetical protein
MKFAKYEVRYTDDHGASSEQCAKCQHYSGGGECVLVSGKINPKGWCNRFYGGKSWKQ